MMQLSSRLSLVLEALELLRIHRRRKRQYLERYAPAQGNLFRLINDAHAAPADLTDNAIITQPARRFLGPLRKIFRNRWTHDLQCP